MGNLTTNSRKRSVRDGNASGKRGHPWQRSALAAGSQGVVAMRCLLWAIRRQMLASPALPYLSPQYDNTISLRARSVSPLPLMFPPGLQTFAHTWQRRNGEGSHVDLCPRNSEHTPPAKRPINSLSGQLWQVRLPCGNHHHCSFCRWISAESLGWRTVFWFQFYLSCWCFRLLKGVF